VVALSTVHPLHMGGAPGALQTAPRQRPMQRGVGPILTAVGRRGYHGTRGNPVSVPERLGTRGTLLLAVPGTVMGVYPDFREHDVIPTLYIQLLGAFRLRFDDRPVTALDLPRLQALLAYLVLHRAAPYARPHLAFRFWPDTTDAQARSNLRTLLQRLRHALPHADQFLQIDAQTVQWRTNAPWTLDVADFEQALAQADQAEHHSDPTALRKALTEAVDCYHGDLLPGWYDDWVLLERERLRQLFLTALERLILVLEREHDYPAAIGCAQRLLRHDPLHEVTYQHLMRLHALSGDRASALRVYHTCTTVLERELGVEPSPTTRDVYERLLHMEAPPAVTSARPTLLSSSRLHNLPSALTSFIGRAHERAEMTQLLARLASGCRLLTLTGTGGCGKTRLALEVAGDLVGEYSDGVWLVELAGLADAARSWRRHCSAPVRSCASWRPAARHWAWQVRRPGWCPRSICPSTTTYTH
jgi:DNA-binding SARP family transcriptional activator